MKATGIVRRIDDLGRVVIPKEIRKVHRIKEGDPLEIFTDKEGEIILKKYLRLQEYRMICLKIMSGELACIVSDTHLRPDSLIKMNATALKHVIPYHFCQCI